MRVPLLIAGALGALLLVTPDGARAQNVPVTVTVGSGRSVNVSGQDHGGGKKGQVPAEWKESGEAPGSVEFLVNGRRVGMRALPTEEGRLSRVHVDAPDGTDLTVIIGFYDAIASPAALSTPRTYECKRCSSTLVCAVRPTCQAE